jgi:hypothetical protein
VEGGRKRGELGGERELLWLLLVLLRVGVGGRDVKDVVAVLLGGVLCLAVGGSVGSIGRLGGALVRLVVMRVVLVVRRLGRVVHETGEFFGEVHGGLGRVGVGLAEGIRKEVWHEHVVGIELGLRLRRRRGRDGWRRGREMKTLLPDLRFIGRRGIKGH